MVFEVIATILAAAMALVLFGGAILFVDQYWLRRMRMREQDYRTATPEPVLDAKGELSPAAKYAIWTHMFNVLAVGGTVIGVLSGITGYLIKDLVTERAVQKAFNEVQAPLNEQLKKFADAQVVLTTAIARVRDDQAFAKNVGQTIKDEVAATLLQPVARDLYERHLGELRPKPSDIADELAKNHRTEIQGERGAQGLPGKNGPGLDEVVAALMKDHLQELRGPAGSDGKSPTADAVAAELAKTYVDKLRGPQGLAGKNGPGLDEVVAALMKDHLKELRGPAGSDGKSPTADAVAAELTKTYVDKLRGPQGLAGKHGPGLDEVVAALMKDHLKELRGSDGKSPTVDAVAAELAKTYVEKLRGPPGVPGPSATEVVTVLMKLHGPELRGAQGTDGISPSVEAVAAEFAKTFGEKFRGPPGIDAVTPSVETIAAELAEKYSDELRGRMGSPGQPGKDGAPGSSGKDVKNPSVNDVAAAIWDHHQDEIVKGLKTKDSDPPPRPHRRRRS